MVLRRRAARAHAPAAGGTPTTFEEYPALFAAAAPEQRVGEATILYLWSHTAADAIAEVVPDARIVAILREPASLLRSLHLQFLESHIETETDLRTALELEPERRQGRHVPRHTYWPAALAYSEHVRYVEQLRRYERHFGSERMLVLIYDDYRRDNVAAARSVLRFLGVDESVSVQPAEVNPTVGVRSQGLHELLQALTVGRGPVSRAGQGGAQAGGSRDGCAATRCARPRTASCTRSRSRPTRA